jgi:hypothetical protein
MEGLIRIPCPRCSVREEGSPPRIGQTARCKACGAEWTWSEGDLRYMETRLAAIKAALLALPTDDDRLEVLRDFCRGCGRVQPEDRSCQCENDE